jgi:ADP-ribose pyrophosphatase YjhB (NUDIX family)
MVNDTAKELRILLERIHAQASTGLAFSTDAHDLNRYKDILAALGDVAKLLNEKSPSAIGTSVHWGQAPNRIGSQEYVTPKVAVAAIVFDNDNRVLLVKRNRDLWTLPGGFADVGFDPARNVEKEVQEETGLDVKVTALLGIYDSNLHEFPILERQIYTLAFYARLLGGTLRPDPLETMGASFFSVDSFPRVPSVTFAQVELARRVHLGESISPFFDVSECT